MKKKILFFVTVLLAGIIGLSDIITVNAEKYTGQSILSAEYIPNIFVKKIRSNGNGEYKQARFIRRSEDNAFVYCLQPFVEINSGSVYNIARDDYEVYLNMTKEQWDRISLLAYYGYGYGNHLEQKWYYITQVLIWKTAEPTADIFFTNTLNGTRNDSKFASEIAEIENLVANHYKAPNFNQSNITIPLGQTITLNDSNGVLNQFRVKEQVNVEANITGNNLIIKSTGVGDAKIRLAKEDVQHGTPPIVYFADDSQNVMRVGSYDPIVTGIDLKVIGGRVEIIKNDNDNGTTTPQGEASLKGAVYGVYDFDTDKLLTTLTTDENAYAISGYLPKLGKFYLKEITASNGYTLDKNKYEFTIDENNLLVKLNVYEEVIKRDFEFTKVYASDKTMIMTPEVNSKFAIYDSKNKLVLEDTTDKEGKLYLTLPYGHYTLRQLTSTSGYEKLEDYHFEVTETGKTINKVFSNAEITARLKVVKVDENNKRLPIKDIRFKIKDVKTGKFVCQTVTYPNVENICEFKTNKEGELITPYPLNSGKYELYEVDQAIYGYLWNSKPLNFTIDENSNLTNDESLNKILEVHFSNKEVKGEVEIKKIGEKVVIKDGKYIYEEIPLANVTFGLYDKDNNLIAQVTTDENGYAKFKDLKLQKYYLKEIKTADGYVLDGKTYKFDLEYKDQYTPIISKTYNLKNYLVKGELEFTKSDLTDGKTIPDTKIEIFTENDELVFSGITDKNGQIVIKDLFVGKFYIIETEASTGYKITDEKVFFEIKENGEIVKAEMKNEAITGSLEITKVDLSEGTQLPNVLFEIYNDKDELVFSGRTDEDGKILVDKLRYGKYYILEKDAPEGYIINDEKMYFEILEDGEIIKSTIANEKIKVEVPNTLKNDYLTIGIFGLILLGTGTILYGISKKKRKK